MMPGFWSCSLVSFFISDYLRNVDRLGKKPGLIWAEEAAFIEQEANKRLKSYRIDSKIVLIDTICENWDLDEILQLSS